MKRKVVKISAKNLNSTWEKMRGVLFQNEINTVYFETRFGIHTFFLTQEIDILILDNNYVVRKVFEKLSPFRVYWWNPKYFRVIELAGGFIQKNNIEVGTKIDLSFQK